MKHKIKIPLYGCTISFFTSKEELEKATKIETDYQFICIDKIEEGNIFILASDLWGSNTEVSFLRCISHECNHAAMCILGHVGITFDFDNQEALCYLQDFIFSEIISALWKETRKTREQVKSKGEG